MSIATFGITWGASSQLPIILAIVCVAVALLVYRVLRTRRAVKQLSSPHWVGRFLHNYSVLKIIIKALLIAVGTLFLLLALLRPQWHKKEQTVAQQGRDLFIALDVSRSMLAKDCMPNRLACAKEKIKALVKRLSCERVGLLLFSGSAFVRCPLTTDYAAFFMFLDEVDIETIASGTTAIDQVLKKVLDVYKNMPARKTKLVVLFTDGEDFSSNLQQVKTQAQQEGVKIFTIGVGTPEGAPIPIFDNQGRQTGHMLDKKGSVVISRLNEGILSNVAQDSGATYMRMSGDESDVKALVKQVSRFEKEKIEDKKFSTLEEQYPYFLLVSFICFVLEWLL